MEVFSTVAPIALAATSKMDGISNHSIKRSRDTDTDESKSECVTDKQIGHFCD